MARRWRVFAPEMAPATGAILALSADESHHARRVLRLQTGEPLAVFDGEGEEWEAVLLDGDATRLFVRLERRIDDPVEAPCRLSLFQAACRSERLEWAIQKATEIGVFGICVFPAERSERRRIEPKKMERWRRIAVEACKQSGRRRLPTIALEERLPDPVPSVPAMVLHTGSGSRPLADLLAGPPSTEIWLAVGPESGFSDAEVEQAVASGWQPTGLGPRHLRAETAGVAAGAIVLHSWGDLGRE